jgi:very-short-patch-repair endonuclease
VRFSNDEILQRPRAVLRQILLHAKHRIARL